MRKLTAFVLAMLLAGGTMMGCEKNTPGEETTKTPNETVETKPTETKPPEINPVEGEIVNLADEGILICSNPDVDVTEAFDLDISTAVRLDGANSSSWIGIKLPQPAILCYASFSAQDTDYDGVTNSPWDIHGHIIEGSNDGQNWEFILQFGDPYAEYDDYAVEYDQGNNYATEYAFDGESDYDDDATEPKEYRYYRSWNDGKGGPLWGELELWGVLMGEPVESIPTEDESVETEAVSIDIEKGFSVTGEKYPYANNDVLILDVENTTDTHYSVLLTVTFYDEAGKEIRVQKRSYTLFPAKYKMFCLFQPNLQFASYTCEMSGEKYLGENDYLSTFSCGVYTSKVGRHEDKFDPTTGGRATFFVVDVTPTFCPCTTLPAGKRLWVETDVIVFDNTGKIYTIVQQRHNSLNT